MVASAAIVGSTLAGGYMSSQAAKSAASSQSSAANDAANAQLQQFNTVNSQQAPYRQAGYSALNQLAFGLGDSSALNPYANKTLINNDQGILSPDWGLYNSDPIYKRAWDNMVNTNQGILQNGPLNDYQVSKLQNQIQSSINSDPAYAQSQQSNSGGLGFGQFLHQFNTSDLNDNLAPNYAFMRDQGLGQLQNASNATGGLLSGNTLQGLNTFAQNYAQNAYQQAYQNYNSNQSNIFNRLADIAGLGQTANQSTANAGIQSTAAANNYLTSAAAANAAGTVGQANAWSNAANSLGTIGAYYGMKPADYSSVNSFASFNSPFTDQGIGYGFNG